MTVSLTAMILAGPDRPARRDSTDGASKVRDDGRIGDATTVESTSEVSHSEFAPAMKRFYEEVDAAVAAHRPVCANRGACCRFAEAGHRLFVTDVELRYFVEGIETPRGVEAEACPYQVGGVCTTRAHRPLGCRIYFCEERSQAWQSAEYERFLARLKELGARFGIPYRYREWLSALRDGLVAES